MKSAMRDLGGDKRDIKIRILSDLHIGSPKCLVSKIKEEVKEVASDPNCYVILAGDLIDNGTKGSVNPYGDILSPMEQMKQVISILEPIKDKILAICQGNHEYRTFKESGTDLTWFLAKQFGIEEYYDPVGMCLFVKFGHISTYNGGNGHDAKVVYSIYLTHGSGGGSTVGGKANVLHKRGNIISADVVCMGHTHQPMAWKEDAFVARANQYDVIRKETTYVMTGSWLEYEEYAHRIGLPPSSIAIPTITLGGYNKRFVKVDI